MQKTLSPYLLYAHIIFISVIIILNVWTSFILTPVNYPDTETYELPVLEFLSGTDVSPFVRPIGYPFFIGIIYKLFGATREFVIYAQQALGVLAYLLHYLAFRYFAKNAVAAAVLAFIVSASGTLIFYERAMLADFLNYFVLLAALLFFFRYYAKGERPLFLALSSISALLAYLIRPNSLLLFALSASFLLFETVFRHGKRLKRLKHLALYSIVFIVSLLAADLLTYFATGRTAKTIGVGAPTLLSRVADHINYGAEPHLEIKERYRTLRLQHRVDYGKDPFTADASAAYALMTEIECGNSREDLEEYQRVAKNAERFYGSHDLSSYYFTIYDFFRLSKCKVEVINGIFKEITMEAVLNDPSGYAKSVFMSAWDYIQIPSADYGGIIRMQKPAGALSSLPYAFAFIGELFDDMVTTGFFLFAFMAGGIFYFYTGDRSSAEYRLAAYLSAYLAANYLSIAVFMNVLSPRYKLPVYWVQLILLYLFAGTALRKIIKRI